MKNLAPVVRRALVDMHGAAILAVDMFSDSPAVLSTLMNFATVPIADVEDFEANGTHNILIDGRFGRFWLVPGYSRKPLMPPAPQITMRGLRALGLGLIDRFAVAA